MLHIDNVSKSYNGGKSYAVHDLSLEIRPGEIFGLLGPNGAGKSTLLKMMVGILAPNQGDIVLNGYSITQTPYEAKRQFGYVSDSPDHLLRLKGHEYLRFMAEAYQVPQAERAGRVETLAARFDMTDVLANPLQSYSHGMRQKMMVMGALLSDPTIWILDEPMTGLDPKAAYLLKQSMREHADKGKVVLFSTHVLEVAEKLVDRLGIIKGGKLLFVGTVDELRTQMKANDSLEDLFLELVGEGETHDEQQA